MEELKLYDLGVVVCSFLAALALCLVKVIAQLEQSRCSSCQLCCIRVEREVPNSDPSLVINDES